jgi:hypothetical protein
MIESKQTVKVNGRVTNDAWGGKTYGQSDMLYIHDDVDHDTHDIRDILAQFSGKNVIITISEV